MGNFGAGPAPGAGQAPSHVPGCPPVAGTSVDNLSPNQEAAIVALLNQPTIQRAAESCGVAERTVHRWLDDPAFQAAYRKARREAFAHAISQAQRYAPVAVQVLTQVMADRAAPHSARINAASNLLKFAREAIELDDLQARVEALEARAGEDDAAAPEPPHGPGTPRSPPPKEDAA